jgi:hypothetical protein
MMHLDSYAQHLDSYAQHLDSRRTCPAALADWRVGIGGAAGYLSANQVIEHGPGY